jgi:hypothetical protein
MDTAFLGTLAVAPDAGMHHAPCACVAKPVRGQIFDGSRFAGPSTTRLSRYRHHTRHTRSSTLSPAPTVRYQESDNRPRSHSALHGQQGRHAMFRGPPCLMYGCSFALAASAVSNCPGLGLAGLCPRPPATRLEADLLLIFQLCCSTAASLLVAPWNAPHKPCSPCRCLRT